MKHCCHFPNCPLEVEPKLWGCKRHWMMLPVRLRNLIWREYRPGQDVDKRPSAAYLRAADTVRAWILNNLGGEVARLKANKPTEQQELRP